MEEILTPEHRDELIERFTHVAKADILTNMDALTIVKILEEACRRADAELEEEMLKAMLEGDEPECLQ